MSISAAEIIQRREGIGASEAAAAVGLSPWTTQYQLYLEKIGEGPPREDDDALHLEMGHALEPVALSRFCKATRLQISDRQRKFVDPVWPRRWVTVDAIASDDGCVEAKSTGFADPSDWGDELEDGAVPQHYYVQALHSLACSGKPHVWMPLIVTNRQFKLYRIQRDDEAIALLTDREKEFWARVEARDPPPPSNLDDVKLRWPTHQLPQRQADEAAALAIADLKGLKAEIKAAVEKKESLELQIKTFMGSAAAIVDIAGKPLCTWKQNKSSIIFDEGRFALDCPDLYRKYLFERAGARPLLTK